MEKIEIYILAAFMLTMILGVPIRVYRMDCQPNPDVCFNSQCNITTIRKRITLITFGCFYREPQDNVTVRVIMFRKTSGTYKKWMIDANENLCKAMDRTSKSTFLARVLPTIFKFSVGHAACPLKGNNSIINAPLDLSFVPTLIPIGEYKIDATLENPLNKLTNAIIYFRIG